MKKRYAGVLGANSVHYAVTTEPGLDGMRHLPVIDPEIGDIVLYLVGVKQHVNGVSPGGAGQLKTDGTFFRYLTEELQKHGYLAVA